MATLTSRRRSSATLDPHLFTFQPKLNEKSSQIAQNLLSDFYERQSKHAQRLQDLKKEAELDHRQWYCPVKPTELPKIRRALSEVKPRSVESYFTEENDLEETTTLSRSNFASENKPSSSRKEAQQSNTHLSRLIRAYRPPLKVKTIQSIESRKVPSLQPPKTAPILAPIPERNLRRMQTSQRSRSPPKGTTRPTDVSPKRSIPNDSINPERLKLAKDEAEKAMKEHKVFTIIGPYPALRESLRRRGWIEKFYRGTSLPTVHGNRKSEKKNKSDDDDDDDDDDNDDDDNLDEHPSYEDGDKIPPWEENDGYYGLLSRLVRTAAPNFIWSVRATYDTSTLNRDQMVNHYSRNGCFTTKVGLCNSLRNLQWFHSGSAEQFFPRCYKLSHEDDKVAFIDDYRLTSCISFLKLIQNRCKGVIEPDMNSILAMSSDNPTDAKDPLVPTEEEPQLTRSLTMPPGQLLSPSKPSNGKSSLTKKVPSAMIEFALNKATEFTLAREHEDIDINSGAQSDSSDEQWAQFIEQFYAASHSNTEIEGMEMYLNRIDECLKNVELHCPQYHIDGTRNIWILKPGAKSRGRGIVVYDRLEDILKLCSSTLTKDGKFVVQKYIERPLLIHNTKFDIRQWFLVTDWNPLTIWIYKDSYFRFCTEHFSLETRQQNVHLCNYSIQKHYKNNSKRHIDLPVENMWTNTEFIDKYLRPNNLADQWGKTIYPALKEAIICSMLVAQDTIDQRKNSFELFGADFMLGEDLKPWLIEINCSPTMARSTAVTADMCDSVLEDTCKVMIDRKYSRTADIGGFQLIHRGTPVPVPIYVGIDLRVEGKICKTGRPANNPPAAPAVPTQNNNNTTNTPTNIAQTFVHVPPQTNASSPVSTSSSPPAAETRPTVAQPSTTPNSHSQSFSTKNHPQPVTLKLRREMTQPVLSRVELVSSLDCPIEKIAANDNFSIPYRANINSTKVPPNQSADYRYKQIRINASRLSAEYFPVRQISRSRVNDSLPSPKGNHTKHGGIPKINVTDFLFAGKGAKSPNQFPSFCPYQRNWFAYKPQPSTTASIKPIRPQQFADDPANLPSISTLSVSTTPNLDANDGPLAQTPTMLTVA